MTTKRFMMAAADGFSAELWGGSKVRLCRVFALALTLCGSVSGQTVWKSAVDGLWTNAAAWTEGVPNGNAAALTNSAGSYAVTVDTTPATPYGALIISNALGNTTRLNVNASGFTSTNGIFVLGRGAEVVVSNGGVMGYSGRPTSVFDDFFRIKDGGTLRIDGGKVDFADLRLSPSGTTNSFLLVGDKSAGRLEINSGELRLTGATVAETNKTVYLRVGYGAGGNGELVMTGGNVAIYNLTSGSDFNNEALNVGCGGNGARGTVSLSGGAVVAVSNAVAIGGSRGFVTTGTVDVAGSALLAMSDSAYMTIGRFSKAFGTLTIRENGTVQIPAVNLGYENGRAVLNIQDNGTLKVGSGGILMTARSNTGSSELNLSGNGCILSGGALQMSLLWDPYPGTSYSVTRLSGNGLISAKGILVAEVGFLTTEKGTAELEIGGGIVTNTSWFIVGNGGSLATGRVTQTGGYMHQAQTAKSIFIGMGGGYGSYALSGGRVDAFKNVYVGGAVSNEFALALGGDTRWHESPDDSTTGLLQINGGVFNVTNSSSLCLGGDGKGTLAMGSNGLCVADNIILSNQVQSVVHFTFGEHGIGTLSARQKLVIAAGAKLEVDATAYEGAANWVKLIDCSTREGAFAAENITVTGGGVVVQDKDEDIWLQKSRGTVIQLL